MDEETIKFQLAKIQQAINDIKEELDNKIKIEKENSPNQLESPDSQKYGRTN